MQVDQATAQIISSIEAGKLAEADAAVDKLITDCAGNAGLFPSIVTIADTYCWRRMYDKAKRLCRLVIDKSPDSPWATKARLGIARVEILSLIEQKKYSLAQQQVNLMIVNFRDEPNLAVTLFHIGQEFGWQKRYGEAKNAFDLLIEKSPVNPLAQQARLWLARVNVCALILQRKDEQALAAIDKMISDFEGDAGLPEVLFYMGQEFAWQEQFDKSKDVFDRLSDRFPNSSVVQQARLWSARVDICALIEQGKDEQALAAIDKLISDFKNDAGLPEVVHWISKEFEWVKGRAVEEGATRFDAPKSIYQRLAKEFSDSPYGQQAEQDFKRLTHRIKIFTLMDEADSKGVDAAIEQMAADFAGRPDIIASELCWIASEYEKHPDKADKASAMWERVVVEFPESSEFSGAVSGAVRMAIEAEVRTDAKGEADDVAGRLREQLQPTPRLASALYLAGEAHRVQAGIYEQLKADPASAKTHLEKAAQLYDEVIRLAGESDQAMQAYLRLGHCYNRLQRSSDALNCYKKIRKTWPGSQFEPDCLEGIGICYEELGKQGLVSSSEADYESEQVYKEMVAKYPDRPQSTETLLKLGWLTFKQSRLQDAISYFEKGLAKFPKNSKPADVLYALARMYEKTGQLEKAKLIYDELLRTCNDTAVAEAVKARLEKQSMPPQE